MQVVVLLKCRLEEAERWRPPPAMGASQKTTKCSDRYCRRWYTAQLKVTAGLSDGPVSSMPAITCTCPLVLPK